MLDIWMQEDRITAKKIVPSAQVADLISSSKAANGHVLMVNPLSADRCGCVWVPMAIVMECKRHGRKPPPCAGEQVWRIFVNDVTSRAYC